MHFISSQALWLRWHSGLSNSLLRVSGRTGLVWLVLGIAISPASPQFSLDLFLDFWLAAWLPSTLLGISCPSGLYPRLSLRPLLPCDTLLLRSICMSQRPSDDGAILDLTCTFQSLQISIKGPSNQVLTAHFGGAPRAASPSPTDSSFDLVGSVGPSSSGNCCPALQWLLLLLAPILASLLSVVFQIAPLVGSNSPLVCLDQSCQVRVVLNVLGKLVAGLRWCKLAELDLLTPLLLWICVLGFTLCLLLLDLSILPSSRSSTSYWRVVGSLRNSPAISHSFPSEIEAKVYLAAAGVVDPDTQP